jgi:alkane 1-monooxygenase
MDSLAQNEAPWSTPAILGLWTKHLLCFLYPVSTLLFLATAPHPWYVGIAYFTILPFSVLTDIKAGPALHQPAPNLPPWLFTSVLYLLVAIQLINYVLVVRLPLVSGFFSWDVLFGLIPIGITAGYSGIVVAHELIHRPEKNMRFLGRLLLLGVFYDHWHVEHVRGHHQRVGTLEDPVTAPWRESFVQFHRRAIPAQIVSAWKLEQKRLGQPAMKWHHPRQLKNNFQNRVVQGFVLEFLLLMGILVFFGFAPALLFFAQHYIAHSILEAVNYFEHYGLLRKGPRIEPTESWDTDSWFSLYSLIGLSRHSDHHTYSSRPYQELRVNEESPRLPYGYFGTAYMVLFQNKKFRRLADAELADRHLGPFAKAA